jgi:3-methyladenine DNA glycosylase AlkC
MPIPPEGGLKINSPEEFLRIIRITSRNDLKNCMKYLGVQFSQEYGNDSVKIAGEIMKSVNKYGKEKIENVLKEAGCTNPEKTKRILDRWAGFGIELTPEKQSQYGLMGR